MKTIWKETKDMVKGILENIKVEVEKANNLAELANALQIIPYLMDMFVGNDMQKFEKCLSLYKKNDYKQVKKLFNC